jgi:multisubunit Na+/H+ antiporter MnhC subunit
MTDDVAAADTPTADTGSRTGPSWLSGALIGLATVLAVVSVFSSWVKVQALDTDEWVTLADELLEEPEVQQALATYLVDEIYAELDVAGEVDAAMPDNLKGLAPLVAASLRGPATTGVERLIASNEFRGAWSAINRTAHQTMVDILRDEVGPVVSTADGSVTLDLVTLVRIVGEKLGLSGDLLDRLPDDAGQVTVFESDELESAQTAVKVLDFMSWFSFILVVVLYATAVYLAGDRRRTMFRNVGLSLIGTGVFVLFIRSVGIRIVLDAVVPDQGNRPLASVAAYVGTSLVRQMAWSAIIYGILIAVFASLLGHRRWATSSRRFLAPALNASGGAVAGGTILLIMVLLWWSPGRAFDQWFTGLTLIVLIVAAVVALRRATLREHPDLTFEAVFAGVGGASGDADAAES